MTKFILTILLATCAAATVAAPALPIRVWQFQEYDAAHRDDCVAHWKRLIDMASKEKINRIQISHKIAMYVQQVLAEKSDRPALIDEICSYAHAHGIQVDMWTHEFEDVPADLFVKGKLNLDDPRVWQFVRDRYEKVFKVCPGVDGLVLTFHETAIPVYDDSKVTSSLSHEDRVAKLIDVMNDVCAAHKKALFVRTFAYEPKEEKSIEDGIKRVKGDIIVMTKCVPHDWQPFYPYNHTIGNVGGHRQVTEFDLGHEFTGLSRYPYIMIDYLKRHLDYGISKGIDGAVFRVERYHWRAIDTPNQALIDIYSNMLTNPAQDPHKLYKHWLAARYPAQAVPYLYSAFMRTEDIVGKGLFTLGFWVTNHSLLPDYGYAEKSLHERTSAKWDPSTKPIEQELYNPTPDTIRKIDAEKDAAITLVDASLADIDKAKPYLSATDYTYLKDQFEREKAMVVVWKAAMRVTFGIDVYKRTKSSSDADYALKAANDLDKIADANKDYLAALAADQFYPNATWNLDTAHGIAKYAREQVKR